MMNEYKAFFLSWHEVSGYISSQVSEFLGHRVFCRAIPDDNTYWTIDFSGYHMPLSELYLLLEKANATNDERRDSIPETDQLSLNSIGMMLSIRLLKIQLCCTWKEILIVDLGIWLIGVTELEQEPFPLLPIFKEKLPLKEALLQALSEGVETVPELLQFYSACGYIGEDRPYCSVPVSTGNSYGCVLAFAKDGIVQISFEHVYGEHYELLSSGTEETLTRERYDRLIEAWDNYVLRTNQFLMWAQSLLLKEGECKYE